MNLKFIYVLILSAFFTLSVFAPPNGNGNQNGNGVGNGGNGGGNGGNNGGGPPNGGGPCWPPPCIPIDGGISLLIAAGAIYGSKKLYTKNKE